MLNSKKMFWLSWRVEKRIILFKTLFSDLALILRLKHIQQNSSEGLYIPHKSRLVAYNFERESVHYSDAALLNLTGDKVVAAFPLITIAYSAPAQEHYFFS